MASSKQYNDGESCVEIHLQSPTLTPRVDTKLFVAEVVLEKHPG